jgi:hypothetical protein
MLEKEGPSSRLQLVEGFARIDRDHRAVLGVLADLASRVARPRSSHWPATDRGAFSGMSPLDHLQTSGPINTHNQLGPRFHPAAHKGMTRCRSVCSVEYDLSGSGEH